MDPGMVAAIVVLAVLVAAGVVAVQRSRRAFRKLAEAVPDMRPDVPPASDPAALQAAVRLTSGALRTLPAPTWRVVYEIAADRLTGTGHVLIGPPGAFALTTTIEPLPAPADPDTAGADPADPVALARAAMTRGGLDDALARVRLASAGLVAVHWGGAAAGMPAAVAGLHGVTHVDGRRLAEWAEGLGPEAWSPAQVDLAWQSVVTAIGRPDPLA